MENNSATLTSYKHTGDVTGEVCDQETETTFSECIEETPNLPPRTKPSCMKEMSPKFLTRAQIAGLLIVTVIVWGLLLIPIIIFYVSVKAHHDSPMTGTTRNETLTCQIYNGSICHEELLSMTRRYLRSASEHPSVATYEHQDDAESILSILNVFGSQQCLTNDEVRPFLCLHFFGLCDMDTGVSYRPCVSQCKNMRDNICVEDWTSLASSGVVSLPNCDDQELFDDTNLLCDQQEIQKETSSGSGEADLLIPYYVSDSNQDRSLNCSSLECREGFYCDDDTNTTTCKPQCGAWSQLSPSVNTAIDFFILLSICLGIIGGLSVLIVAVLRRKNVLVFPSILVVYQTITTLVLGVFVLISYMGNTALYCHSQDLLHSMSNPTMFCKISGIVFYYCLSQLAVFWLCHIFIVFWGLRFPFAARRFRKLNRMKYIHVICVILGLLLPILPVAATIIQYSSGKSSSEAIQGGLGFGLVRFPPILCAGREKNTTFYSLIFPATLILMVGITFLIYIFWIIHKQQGLFGNRQGNQKTNATAERKILIVFIYHTIFTVIAMLTFSQSIRDSKPKIDAISNYFACESQGIDNDDPCDTSGYKQYMVDNVLSTMGFVLTGLYPIINFVFVVNFRQLKEGMTRCISCHRSRSSHNALFVNNHAN